MLDQLISAIEDAFTPIDLSGFIQVDADLDTADCYKDLYGGTWKTIKPLDLVQNRSCFSMFDDSEKQLVLPSLLKTMLVMIAEDEEWAYELLFYFETILANNTKTQRFLMDRLNADQRRITAGVIKYVAESSVPTQASKDTLRVASDAWLASLQ